MEDLSFLGELNFSIDTVDLDDKDSSFLISLFGIYSVSSSFEEFKSNVLKVYPDIEESFLSEFWDRLVEASYEAPVDYSDIGVSFGSGSQLEIKLSDQTLSLYQQAISFFVDVGGDKDSFFEKMKAYNSSLTDEQITYIYYKLVALRLSLDEEEDNNYEDGSNEEGDTGYNDINYNVGGEEEFFDNNF